MEGRSLPMCPATVSPPAAVGRGRPWHAAGLPPPVHRTPLLCRGLRSPPPSMRTQVSAELFHQWGRARVGGAQAFCPPVWWTAVRSTWLHRGSPCPSGDHPSNVSPGARVSGFLPPLPPVPPASVLSGIVSQIHCLSPSPHLRTSLGRNHN